MTKLTELKKKKDASELTYKTETDSTDTKNKHGYQRGNLGRVINQELGMNRHTPPYTRQATNTDLQGILLTVL